MMTRKDYIETAEILSDFRSTIVAQPNGESTFEGLVYRFSVMFENDNPRFDSARFETACLEGK